MAKLLIATLYDKSALGPRQLSSFLKLEGHRVELVWIKEYENLRADEVDPKEKPLEELNVGLTSRGPAYYCYPRPITDTEVKILLDLIDERSPDLLGFSVTSMFRRTAEMLTAKVREKFPDLPIIWGGICPTIEREECIAHADMICVGEGEYAVRDLLNVLDGNGDPRTVKNLWVRKNGEVTRNELYPLEQDLDRFPFPDVDRIGKFGIARNGLTRNDPAVSNYGNTYDVMTARGCPYHCTFCCESLLHEMYKGQRFLRRRSVMNVIEELRRAKELFHPYRINVWDEIFSLDEKWIAEFAPLYRDEVGIPYWCYVHPILSKTELLRSLKESGVLEVRMGVQSGSERINRDIYRRPTRNEDVLQACLRLKEVGIKYGIDLITNNPFETEEDRRETLELLLSLPRPLDIGDDTLSILSFFPHFELTRRLEEEGISPEVDESTYRFYNTLYLMAQYRSPALVRRLSHSAFLRRHPRLLRLFFPNR